MAARLWKAFHAWAQPGFSPFRLDYDADRIDALAKERALEWSRIGSAAFLTVDEQRQAAGYGPMGKRAKYSADQPRVAAGSPEGGQWTSGDGNGGGDLVQVALNTIAGVVSDVGATLVGEGEGYFVDLLAEMERGGHAVEQHVGKSDEFLLNRVRTERFPMLLVEVGLQAAGSFPSLEAANKLVNATLSRNSAIVEAVANGSIGGDRVEAFFDSPTGKEAFANSGRSTPYMRDTFGVRVLLQHDKSSPNGFTVFTAFPTNRRERR